ncbi:MAG: pyridoxal-dependent decarboxylase [Planctomycetaceae bacterium]|nr:pyridoxal-dependent decarboxylase [Planctomycetaceae bacterium]
MTAPYYKLVSSIRRAFPQPVSDREHDAYFVFSIMRALDQVDAMKSESPVLGEPRELDLEAARQTRIAKESLPLESVTEQLVDHLSGAIVWGHPRAQINVIPPPTIPGIIGSLLPSIYNPNLASEESSRLVALSEVEVSAMTADLVGYDPTVAQGVFTFGGTGTLLYAARIGLEKACPGSMKSGIREPAVIVASKCAHYACRTIAGWMGLGEDSFIEVPSSPANEVRTNLLESTCREALKSGQKIAMIVATMGTTDAFGLDDLARICDIRDRMVEEFSLDYVPHIHADAVIGWAWSVFNDYDFDQNPQGFQPRAVRSLAGTQRRISQLHLSDSIGIDFHKTGFTPYTSSLFLTKSGDDLALVARDSEAMPYLFKSGEYHPGKYTLETSRSGAGPMAALGNLLLLGRDGLQALLGHLVTMAESLAEHLEGHAATTVLNSENFGPVTLFRVYPSEIDTFTISKREMTDPTARGIVQKNNEYNRRIFAEIQAEALQGRGVILSLTDCYRKTDYGEPVVALKSYIMSPFSDEEYVAAVLESVCKARETVS